jgi:7-cyano-7-deazaguanine synthase in queuosine biosynthesis
MRFSVTTPTGARDIDIVLPHVGPYGVLVSGGIDSSVMLALILMARKQEQSDVPFTALNVKRGYGTEAFSAVMVNRMAQHFGVPIHYRNLDLPEGTPHHECLTTPVVPLLKLREYRMVFSGDTSNPPALEHAEAPNREPVENQDKYAGWKLPLLHCDKSHIVQLMYDLDLDFIADESHTCYAQNRLRCNVCFQCTERAWAFKMVGRPDTGQH